MNALRLVATVFFIAYTALLMAVIVFKYPVGSVFTLADSNFVPFKTILTYLNGQPTWVVAKSNLIGNLAPFVPLGLFAAGMLRVPPKGVALAATLLALGSAAEVAQLLFRTGVFDIDDIILNTLGVVVGYGFATIVLTRMYLWNNKTTRLRLLGVVLFIALLALAAFLSTHHQSAPDIPLSGSTDEWVIYENAHYGFSFAYPKSGVVEIDTELPQESPYFFKVYERDKYTDDTDRFGDKPLKYSIAFLDYAAEAKWPSACLRNIPEYEIIQFGETEAYTGITVPDEWTGVGGGSTKVCVTRDGRNFAVVGQDFTEENILEKVIQSLQFTHPSPAHTEPITHTLPPVPVPEGWYEHRLTDSRSMLTRSPTLPDVGPDPRAHGEQISISTGRFDGEQDNREQWHYIRWVFEDEVLVRNWSWTTVRGLDALRVESEAAGASGGVLYYFIFSGDQFFTLSLYPFDTSEHVEEFEELVWTYAAVIYASSTFETRAAGIARAAQAMQDLVSHDTVAVEEIIATYYDLVLPNGSVQTSIFSKADTNLHDFFFPYLGELPTKVAEEGQPEYEAFRQAFVLPDAPAADFAFPYRVGNTSGGRMVGAKALGADMRIAYGAYDWTAYGSPPANLCKQSGITIDTFTFKKVGDEWKVWEIDNAIDKWVTNEEGATEEACREINQDKIEKYQNP